MANQSAIPSQPGAGDPLQEKCMCDESVGFLCHKHAEEANRYFDADPMQAIIDGINDPRSKLEFSDDVKIHDARVTALVVGKAADECDAISRVNYTGGVDTHDDYARRCLGAASKSIRSLSSLDPAELEREIRLDTANKIIKHAPGRLPQAVQDYLAELSKPKESRHEFNC